MQINLPDDPRFQATAAAAGFTSVEDYVLAMLEHETNPPVLAEEAATQGQQLSHDQWKQKLHALQDIFKSCNPNFDDSRESLYPVRS